ncbi:MAG: hypothetical protein ATN31_03470 [Candidatus Epulonipiscioides saccharophilum]|nr:MAG: hypothetical protein ATN31_03470 [Epulopiscium sp. AS2M-Bin001]
MLNKKLNKKTLCVVGISVFLLISAWQVSDGQNINATKLEKTEQDTTVNYYLEYLNNAECSECIECLDCLEENDQPLALHSEVESMANLVSINKYEIEAENEQNSQVTFSISCETLLNNINALDENKHSLVPADGIIYNESLINIKDGETAFDVLLRLSRENKIHMEYVDTPIYGSAYIEGINNLYAFDAGGLSGWMYRVNGQFPNYGCSKYQLKAGDHLEFLYTCDLGKDLNEGEVVIQS